MNSSIGTARETEDDIDFIALCRVVWRYKYLIATVTFVTTLAAVVYALVATPVYRGQVVVTEVRDRGAGGAAALISQFGGLASLAGMSLPAGGGADREAQAMLRSRHLAEEFVRHNELVAELSQNNAETKALWFAVESFRNNVIKIQDDKRAGTLTVSVEWTEPAKAARWANDYVALANDRLRARAIDEASRNIAYLREQATQTNVVELQRVMYQLIESETKTLMLANGRTEYAFTVVDPAVVPEQRAKPYRRVIALVGLLLGVLIGGAVAIVHDRVRARPGLAPAT